MKKSFLLSTALSGATLLSGYAVAADVPSASDQIEEIVVTAQKTRTLESKTPISMETLDAGTIASKGISDIQSLANQNTSVNFASGGGEGYITLRGVASQNTTETGDPAVPVSIDGFFLNRPYTFNNTLYDVSRIEVLRGPQGTLYGRNATGGVINVITADPTKKFEGFGELTLGDYGATNLSGAINIPIDDKVQVRASFSSLYHDGYRNNGPVGKGDDEDSRSGRIKVAVEPTDHLRALLTFELTHVGGTGATDQVLPFQNVVNQEPSHTVSYFGDGKSFPLIFEPSVKIDDKQLRWNFSYDDLPAGITVTYLGGYDEIGWHHIAPTSPTTNQAFLQNEEPKTQNHELRFSSPSDQPWTWQIGAFFFNETDPALFSQLVNDYQSPQQADFAVFKYAVNDDSYAIFGQTSYDITPEIKVTGGARYTMDDKSEVGTFSLPEFGVVSPENLHGTWSKATWHAGVDWNPTASTLVYAKADRGYKSGGFTGNGTYAPETLTAWELGTKNKFLNNKVTVSADGFYQDYEGQQVSALAPLGTGNTGVKIQNAGSSEIYGIELQAKAILDPIGRFDLNGTWLHARFTDFKAANGSGSANFQLAGNTLPQAPNVSIGAGFEHSWPIFSGLVTTRIETKYQSTQYFSFFNYADSKQSGYSNSNAYLRYDDNDGRYEVEFFVRNLENTVALADFAENFSVGVYNYGFIPPRTFGARVRANF